MGASMVSRIGALLLVGALVFAPAFSRADEDICAIPKQEFASCQSDYRAFRSIVVAVHGWNGSCAETFGSNNDSLLKTLQNGGAFDVDCFAYDTNNTPIAKSADQLRAKIGKLVELGYDEFFFVTHSMGGIVVLQMLMDDGLAADGTKLKDSADSGLLLRGNGPHVAGVHAWAVPLDGLRSQVNWSGKIINFLGFSPAALPELAPGSTFLVSLNNSLQEFYKLAKAAAPPDRARMQFDLTLYQGKNDDWVVVNVPSGDPLLADNPDFVRMVLTEDGHSHNVSNGGTVTEPKYPQELLRDKALLTMSLEPRFTEIFRSDLPFAPESLLRRQSRIINGTIQFCKDNFEEAIRPVSDLIAKIITGQFVRSAQLDFDLVDRFASLVEVQATHLIKAKQYGRVVELFDTIVSALDSYDPQGKKSGMDFGKGNAQAIDRLIDTVRYIVDRLGEIANLSGTDGTPVDPQALAQVETKLLNLAPRYLYAGHDTVRSKAIDTIHAALQVSSQQAIDDSQVVESLARFAVKYAVDLPEKEKFGLADGFRTASKKTSEKRDIVFEALNSDASGTQKGTKVWAVIMDNQRVDQILADLPVSYKISDPEFQFVVDVVERGGATGNSSTNALAALDIGQAVVDSKFKTDVGQIRLEQLQGAVEMSKIPRVAKRFDQWRP